MKINVFEILGIISVASVTGYTISKVGTYSTSSDIPYGWETVLVVFVITFVPLVLGYLSGINDRRKW